MKINYDLDMEDWMAFQRFHLSHDKAFKRKKLFMTVLYPTISLGVIISRAVDGKDLLYPILIFTAITVAFHFLFTRTLLDRTVKRVRKQFETQDNSEIIGPCSIDFSDKNKIDVKGPKSTVHFNWDDILKIGETPDHIFVYIGQFSAHILPKNKLDFKSGTKQELDQLIESHID